MRLWHTAILCICQIASQAQVITSPRPLVNAIDRFQKLYSASIITYEEVVPVWPGDLLPHPGRNPKGALFPKTKSFSMLAETGSDQTLSAALNSTMDSYNRQTSGTHFRILESKWGYHIVPVEAPDEHGNLVPVHSVLDSRITLPSAPRTPAEHLAALGAAITAASGLTVEAIALPGSFDGFDRAFRSKPERFVWGAESMVARDALIDFLSRSATRFSWLLMCEAAAKPADRFCALNLVI